MNAKVDHFDPIVFERPGVTLTRSQVDAFGREIDALREEIMADLGEQDARYIRRLVRTQKGMELAGRGLLFLGVLPPAWLAGTALLSVSKILENMEIAHNVLHAQWDWLGDPALDSSTYDWDNTCPAEQWKHSHNYMHHTFTNVVGKDRDVGYGIMRVTPMQKWKPAFLLQPIYFILLMLLFEEGVAVHEQAIDDHLKGKNKLKDFTPLLKRIGYKVWRQVAKDYIAWPLAAALVAIPISFYVPFSPLLVFGMVAGANAVANLIRNIWAFTIIFCGHFPAGAHNFTLEQVEGETRGRWYLRQMLGSCNIEGSKLFHILSGNLSHQIEHHLFPDMCSNRYKEVAPRVRALADRYGIPYNSASLFRQFGTTWLNNLRLACPGGGEPYEGSQSQTTPS